MHPQRVMTPALVLVPTHNEAGTIDQLGRAVLRQDPGISVLFIDDGSTDGSRRCIKALTDTYPHRAFSLFRPLATGIGNAYKAGFQWALHQRAVKWVIQMDGDGSHQPEALVGMLAHLQNYDMVLGSRFLEASHADIAWPRRRLSRWGGSLARLRLGTPLSDPTGGFNGWHRALLARLDFSGFLSAGHAFQVEIKHHSLKLGATVKEMPIIFLARQKGRSKLRIKHVLEALHLLYSLRKIR